jgi:hypothetical protein
VVGNALEWLISCYVDSAVLIVFKQVRVPKANVSPQQATTHAIVIFNVVLKHCAAVTDLDYDVCMATIATMKYIRQLIRDVNMVRMLKVVLLTGFHCF